jgi:hypothetical protein
MLKVSLILEAERHLRKTSNQSRKRKYKKQIRKAERRLAHLPRYSLLEELHNRGDVILLSDNIGNPIERVHRGPHLFIARPGVNFLEHDNDPWNNDETTRKYDPYKNCVADLHYVTISLDIVRPAHHGNQQPFPKYYYARPPPIVIQEQVYEMGYPVHFFSQQVDMESWSEDRLSEANKRGWYPFFSGNTRPNEDGIYPKERSKIRVTVSILSLRRQ